MLPVSVQKMHQTLKDPWRRVERLTSRYLQGIIMPFEFIVSSLGLSGLLFYVIPIEIRYQSTSLFALPCFCFPDRMWLHFTGWSQTQHPLSTPQVCVEGVCHYAHLTAAFLKEMCPSLLACYYFLTFTCFFEVSIKRWVTFLSPFYPHCVLHVWSSTVFQEFQSQTFYHHHIYLDRYLSSILRIKPRQALTAVRLKPGLCHRCPAPSFCMVPALHFEVKSVNNSTVVSS